MNTLLTSNVVVDRVLNSFVFRSRVSYEFWFGLLIYFVIVYSLWTFASSYFSGITMQHQHYQQQHSSSPLHKASKKDKFIDGNRSSKMFDKINGLNKTKQRGRINSDLAMRTALDVDGILELRLHSDPPLSLVSSSSSSSSPQIDTADVSMKSEVNSKRKVSFDLLPQLCSINTLLPPSNRRSSSLGSPSLLLGVDTHDDGDSDEDDRKVRAKMQLHKLGFIIEFDNSNNNNNNIDASVSSNIERNLETCILLALILYRRSIFISQGINVYHDYFSASKKLDEALRMRACSFDENETPGILKEIALEHRLKEELPHMRNIFPCCVDDFLSMNVSSSFSLTAVLRMECKRYFCNIAKDADNLSKFLSLLDNNKVKDHIAIIRSSNIFCSN